jgi:hypothetical protein
MEDVAVGLSDHFAAHFRVGNEQPSEEIGDIFRSPVGVLEFRPRYVIESLQHVSSLFARWLIRPANSQFSP